MRLFREKSIAFSRLGTPKSKGFKGERKRSESADKSSQMTFEARQLALTCPGGGMVYTKDLKSFDLTILRVRVPPRAPNNIFSLWARDIILILGMVKNRGSVRLRPLAHIGTHLLNILPYHRECYDAGTASSPAPGTTKGLCYLRQRTFVIMLKVSS